jgi:3'-5' exoribonuclease
MKSCYVNELAEGAKVDAVFALRAKEIRATKASEAYLALEVADRSGQIHAVYFRPSPEASALPVGAVARVRGTVTSFRGAKRISVDSMSAAASWDPEDLLASGTRSTEELVAEFKALVRSVSDPELRRVLTAVFGDRTFFGRFVRCPGAQSYHHAYLGGLLEHTVAVATLSRSLGDQYPHVDRDLLVTAALLHDVGKVDELSFDVDIGYTEAGRLLGHVVLGINRLHDIVACARVRVSVDRMARLEHAVVSHHGELEWGSPKRPSTFEALLLHHADNLDAKAAGFSAILGRATRADEAWTDAGNLFRRPLYAPRPAEDDRPHHADEDAQYSRRSA